MYKGKRILALIPARGGSKGIPGKNLIPIQGRSLLSYTVEAARQCDYIDTLMVSTDDEKIAVEAKACGAEVPFLRPEELAQDTSKTIDCVLDAIRRLEEPFDILILLQPTSPLRDGEDIKQAVEQFFQQGQKGLVSISKVQDNPLLIRKIIGETMQPLLPEGSTVRRQDMKEYYRVNGAIYINKIEEVTQTLSFNDNPSYIILPDSHGLDIDEMADVIVADFYLSNK